ncbi:MAG: 50S ribosomal protein L18 [Nitrospirae bacterium]|nr:50S ribosomal protein L18 [Nitrospirota bacterium]MCL5062069.1 50S ribosomal protein L18 [Nitrospirota bacterium]MDA8213876.1 50S ribosomal protein L18 [Nitrospiraceae bacterium]MDA8338551.1 50S ribosomal protein L18 [Nitrospiraceae bacterium]
MNIKELARQRRHARLRKKVSGTTEKPRLSVRRSLNHIYAQIIDDTKGYTIVFASTLDKDLKSEKGHKGNVAMAKKVGQLLASKATKAGIKSVVFDRGGYKYHGCINALAEAAREGGLKF